jgi:hypothetical protein
MHGPAHHHHSDDDDDEAEVDEVEPTTEGDARPAEAEAGPDTPAPTEPRRPPKRTKSRWEGWLELIITIALGLAAVVGAFAAYRNEERNHEATLQFSLGVRNFDDAGQFYSTGNATFSNDQSLFLEYAKAIQQNNKQLATYIFNNLMGPNLQAAIRWWEGPNAKSKHPARTPFTPQNPDYKIPQIAAANASTSDSRANFAVARREQDKADHYTLVEVILATSLFLYGIAGVTRNMTLKIGTLVTGLLIFAVSIILLLT